MKTKVVVLDNTGNEQDDWKFEIWPEQPKTGLRVGMPRGVKVTHLPTGMVETCASERSAHDNRDKAINALAARLVQLANTGNNPRA